MFCLRLCNLNIKRPAGADCRPPYRAACVMQPLDVAYQAAFTLQGAACAVCHNCSRVPVKACCHVTSCVPSVEAL